MSKSGKRRRKSELSISSVFTAVISKALARRHRLPPQNSSQEPQYRTGRNPNMRNRKKAKQPSNSTPVPQDHCCIQGEPLAALLKSIRRVLESSKTENGGDSLPQKFWFKQQFAMGVNEVTRVLERMSPATAHSPQLEDNPKSPSVQLQAVLVASDCNPRWLTRHLPSLASSRKVPLLFVKGDQKGAGSLRLGELVNLKTAIAVGVKVKGNAVNQCLEEHLLIRSNEVDLGKEQLTVPS